MVEHWNIWWWNSRSSYGGTVEQRWFNTRTVEHWNRDGGTVKHLIVEQSNVWWWKSGTETVEQSNILWWNSGTSDGGSVEHVMVEQWNIRWWNSRTSNGGTVEQRWWRNIRSSDCATVEERWWNSGTDVLLLHNKMFYCSTIRFSIYQQSFFHCSTIRCSSDPPSCLFHCSNAYFPVYYHQMFHCSTMMVEQWNRYGGTLEHLMVEQ